MTKDEALKLALEALMYASYEDIEYDEACAAKVLAAKDAIKEALANEALEKKAENARELGLNYEPEHGWTPERIAGIARLKEAQDKKLAQPEQEYHAVNAVHKGQQCYVKTKPKEPEQKPMHPQLKAMLEEYFDKCFAESAPQRTWVGLTDEEIDDLSRTMVKGNKSVNWLCRAIEAKLKEKNS